MSLPRYSLSTVRPPAFSNPPFSVNPATSTLMLLTPTKRLSKNRAVAKPPCYGSALSCFRRQYKLTPLSAASIVASSGLDCVPTPSCKPHNRALAIVQNALAQCRSLIDGFHAVLKKTFFSFNSALHVYLMTVCVTANHAFMLPLSFLI